MAVVGAGELEELRRGPVAARASRIALIDASVPDEVIRSMSTDGIRARDRLGELDLARRGRAEASSRSAAASVTASRTAGCAWPWISGPHEQT